MVKASTMAKLLVEGLLSLLPIQSRLFLCRRSLTDGIAVIATDGYAHFSLSNHRQLDFVVRHDHGITLLKNC